MSPDTPPTILTVFFDFRRIARGTRAEVLDQLRRRDDAGPYLVFDDQTGAQLDLDLRELPDPEAEHRDEAPRGVGRPKLGVVAREVTLLPRHWDWLGRQPGGASVALRKLVDEARRVHADRDVVRATRETTYRVMTPIAGNLPGFEEATRALFAGERARFNSYVSDWPTDVAEFVRGLAAPAWNAPAPGADA